MNKVACVVVFLFGCWMLRPAIAEAKAETHATVAEVSLPQMVQSSQIIVTGKVVKVEMQTAGPGIDLVICYVQVDGVIKGTPHFVTTDVFGGPVKTVAVGYEVGPNVPGNYWRHDIAEDGVWFMSALPSSGVPGLPQRVNGSYFNVGRRDRTSVEAVKALLRQTDVLRRGPSEGGQTGRERVGHETNAPSGTPMSRLNFSGRRTWSDGTMSSCRR